MIPNMKTMSIKEKEEVFDPLFKEVHDRTIIGFIIKLLREIGGSEHESIVYNKVIQCFSQLKRALGGPYTGDPMSACRAALNSNNIFTKDSTNRWNLIEEQAKKYYQNIKNRLMGYPVKKLMNLSLKYMNGLNQRLNNLSEQQLNEESKITLAISPKTIENHKLLDTKMKLYNRLNDYINKLPIESLRDLIRNPVFEYNESSETFNVPAELKGMLELYEYFRPVLSKYHSTLQFFSQYTSLMNSVDIIYEKLQESVETAEGLYLGKAKKIRRDLSSVALEFSEESDGDDFENHKVDNDSALKPNTSDGNSNIKIEETQRKHKIYDNMRTQIGYKNNCEEDLLFKFPNINHKENGDGKWDDNDSFDDDNNDAETYSQQYDEYDD